MIYQIYYDSHSSNGVVTDNPIVVPFGVFHARSLPRNIGHLYDDEQEPNLTDHNTLCEWRVLFYIWKHRPAPWVGFTSWAHNRKGFSPRIESVWEKQCEDVLKYHNIVGFYAKPLRLLISPDIGHEFGMTLKVQFTQWSILEEKTKRVNVDRRLLPLGKYHHIKYWDFVMREFQSLYGVDLEKELDFRALGDIPVLHTWCNAFVVNWAYFNDYMTTFSPIVISMIDHFGSHPTDLELAYICERLIILHNYIKYTNYEFKTPSLTAGHPSDTATGRARHKLLDI
jgi:hypothetical protein